jgi:hypothetical protein
LWHEVLTVAKLDKACTEAYVAHPDKGFRDAAPRLSLIRPIPPPHLPITFCKGTAPALVERRGAAIAREYAVNKGGGGGKSGALEGDEGRGGAGARRGGGGEGEDEENKEEGEEEGN